MRPPMTIELNEHDRLELERWVRQGATPQKQAVRARMIVLSAGGLPTGHIVARLGTTVPTLMRWRRRFLEAGVAGVGLSATTVRQIWKQAGRAPHRVHGLKLSGDPRFEEKLRDGVGLYLADGSRRNMRGVGSGAGRCDSRLLGPARAHRAQCGRATARTERSEERRVGKE